MKRIITSLVLAVSLIFSGTLAHGMPKAVASDDGLPGYCDDQVAVSVIAVLTVGLGLIPCVGGHLLDVTSNCRLTNVDVTGDTSVHHYDYGMAGDCNFAIRAAYNVNTKQASEQISGPSAKIQAVWTCPSDPWIGQDYPTSCIDISASVNPPTAALITSPAVTPFSVTLLADKDRAVLAAQLQNAINQAPPPAVKLPKQSDVTACPTCVPATQTSVPVLPDLAITRIGGNQQPAAGTSNLYDIVLANLGAKPSQQVQVEIQVTGSLQYLQMTQTPAGFSCTGKGPIVCTGPIGGYGDAPITTSATFEIQVLAAQAGLGSISAAADPNNVIAESNEANNAMTLSVTVK